MNVTVNGKGLHGQIPAIASKSMAHRFLICSALCADPSRIRCETLSEDIKATAGCLSAMGSALTYTGDSFYNLPAPHPKRATLDCKESGSTLRFILPIVGTLGMTCRLELSGRLPSRPLSPLREELIAHGMSVSEEGSNPILVSGQLQPGTYTIRADISSQFISGLLFALPLLSGDSRIVLTGKRESVSYIHMTLSALKTYGIRIIATDDGFTVPGKQKYRSPGEVTVEGDWSNSAFWLAAQALGSPVTVTGLDNSSLQGDREVKEALARITDSSRQTMIDACNIPDLVPILCVVAAAQKKTTVIYNAGRLRIKESDRIATTAQMIRALGASATETEDGLRIKGDPEKLHSAIIDANNDHRIAMSCAIASIACGDITITGAEAVNKSYPAFFEDFRRLGGTVLN